MKFPIWIVLGLFAGTLGFQSTASACNPPIGSANIKIASHSDGVKFGFHAELNLVNLTATLNQGETVFSGSVEELAVGVYVFVPDETVGAGDYTLTLETVFGEEHSRPVSVTEFPVFEIDIEYETAVHESRDGLTCCSTERGECTDTCNNCRTCWPKAYKYSRALELEFTSSQPVVVSVVSASESDTGGRVLALFEAGGRLEYNFLELDHSEACALITASSLNGEELHRTELCVPASEFPSFERRTPDHRDAVSQCVEPPDDTDDPSWQRHSGGSKESGCAIGSGGIASWMLLLAIGFRRRLVSSR